MKPIKPTRRQAQQARDDAAKRMAVRMRSMHHLADGFPPLKREGSTMNTTITQAEAADIREAVLVAAIQSPMEPEALAQSLIQAFAQIRAATSPAAAPSAGSTE